jgi:uncharacterized membrane protein
MSELYLFLFVTNLFICLLLGVLLPILPLLTRKSFLFGVKIPMEERGDPEAKRMTKNYCCICLVGTVIFLVLVIGQYIIAPEMSLLVALYYPFLFVALQALAFIPNWRRAGRLKAERGWRVADTVFADTESSHSRGSLSELPWFWYVLSALVIIGSVIAALRVYPSLPERIPIHWDINMQADGWTDKSYFTVFLMPATNLGLVATMWLGNFMFVRAKLQIDQQSPALSFTQHRLYRRRMGHGLGVLALGLAIMLALLGLQSFYDFTVPAWYFVAIIALSTPVVVISIVSGQGGCKIKPKKILGELAGGKPSTDSTAVSGRGDDKHWALGIFYHNPADPAMIVEDRFGNNLGFNYSRLLVKIGVAVALLALVALYAWVTGVAYRI